MRERSSVTTRKIRTLLEKLKVPDVVLRLTAGEPVVVSATELLEQKPFTLTKCRGRYWPNARPPEG